MVIDNNNKALQYYELHKYLAEGSEDFKKKAVCGSHDKIINAV